MATVSSNCSGCSTVTTVTLLEADMLYMDGVGENKREKGDGRDGERERERERTQKKYRMGKEK